MDHTRTLAIVSDIHYASAAEQARGRDFEFREIANPLLRLTARLYRNYIWLRDPLHQNSLLDRFLDEAGSADYLVANGDYSCNSAFIGLSDDAAFASARECLGKMRKRFGDRFHAIYGDHEMGKKSMFGARGGMLLASLRRAENELHLAPFWRMDVGNYALIGVASSLIALPIFEVETLAEEKAEWNRMRAEHLDRIRAAFSAIKSGQRILLFCHDPTALPFLLLEAPVQSRLQQIEQTIIGHLHTNLVLWGSRLLAGIPPIPFMGNTTRRLSTSLNQARNWRPFKVRLCPALAGIELVKGGGYFAVHLDPDARAPARFQFHRIPRKQPDGR